MSTLITQVSVLLKVKPQDERPDGYSQAMVVDTVREVLTEALAGAVDRLDVLLVQPPQIVDSNALEP